jgi:transcription antitermination factor NusG
MVYTKPKFEKKVVASLTKRKIESIFPVNCKQIRSLRRIKIQHEPLFECYVFVNIADTDISKIKTIDGVVNLVYWKGKPATAKDEEIEVIKEFCTDHQNIVVEKSKVNINGVAKAIDGSKYSMAGNILTVKNTSVKVNLPSLGFSLIANVDTKNTLQHQAAFGEKDLLLQS